MKLPARCSESSTPNWLERKCWLSPPDSLAREDSPVFVHSPGVVMAYEDQSPRRSHFARLVLARDQRGRQQIAVSKSTSLRQQVPGDRQRSRRITRLCPNSWRYSRFCSLLQAELDR